MTEEFKKAYEEYTHDEDGSLSLPCCIDEFEGFARHFYNLALEDVKKDVEKTIGALKKQNPNPLGKITECLADSEITALETVVDFINNQKLK